MGRILLRLKMIDNIVGWLLMSANTSPTLISKDVFYRLKRELLERYGQPAPKLIIQYIVKHCWECNGQGFVGGEVCDRCDFGIYEQLWVFHHRYRLGGHDFLMPSYRQFTPPDAQADIEGYVKKERHWGCQEATLWLLFLFARPVFWRIVRSGFYSSFGYQYLPLTIVVRSIYQVRCWSELRQHLAAGVDDDPDIPF